MDTSHNHLREPSCEDYPFIGAKRYIDGLSQPEKEDILASMAKDVGKIRVENIPDEEDLTQVRQGCHHVLKFKDKIFNPAECSGMGKVFLRKNMVQITCDTSKNILTQSMFEDKHGLPMVNTIFIIQYDYDLDGGFITLPENSVLLFAGGSLRNGTVMLRNTLVLPVALDIEHYMSVNIRGAYKEGSLVYLRKKLRLFDGTHWITIGAHDLTPIMNAVKKYLNFALDIVAPFKIELSTEKNYVERGLNNIRVSWSYNRLISNQDIRLESGHDVRIYEELDKNIRSYTFENVELNEPATIVVSTTYKGETVSEAVTLTFDKNPGLVIDDELDENSANPVTNRAITRVIRSLEQNLENFQQYVNETFLTKVDAENTYLKQVDFDLSEVYNALGNKVDKEAGKGLSSNDFTDSLKDKLEGINLDNYALKNHTHTEYADKNHTHSEYANVNHTHSEYADKNHTHSEYANINHTHSEYATNSDLSNKQDKLPDGRNGEILKWSNGSWQPGVDEKGGDVTWRQFTQEGQHIADITIGGNTTEVYAPSGGGGQSSSQFKEMIFNRKETKPDRPVGGTYTQPITSAMALLGWTDGPSGTGTLWFSTKMFSSDGSSLGEWSDPKILADTENMDVCYHPSVSKPNAPTTHGSQGTDVNTWHDEGNENDRWLAISIKNNGEWGAWSIVKIQGERGEDGTSIKIVGSYNNSADELRVGSNKIVSGVISAHMSIPFGHTLTEGDCLTVEGGSLDGHIIYLSDTSPQVWMDLGVIKGESEYLHIKFSDDGGAHFTPASGSYAPGETPGKYIGMYTDSNPNDSQNVNDYKPWILFKGQDGAGYWFLYTVNNGNRPDTPGCTHVSEEEYKHGFTDDNGVTWDDEPHELQVGEYEWRIWLRDSEETLCWSRVDLYNIGVSNGNTYNLIFDNLTPVYYDSNDDKLTQGTISWDFYVNGDNKTNDYSYRVYDDQRNQKQNNNNQLSVSATDSYKYINVEVRSGSTVIYKEQYVFPVKGRNGDTTQTTGFRVSMNPDFGVIACNENGSSVQGASVSTTLTSYYNETRVYPTYAVQRTSTDPFEASISGDVLTVSTIYPGNAAQVVVPFSITYNGITYIKSFSVIRDKDGNVYNLDVTPQVYTPTDAANGKTITAKVYKTYDRATGSHEKVEVTDSLNTYGLTLKMGAEAPVGTANTRTLSSSDHSNIEISLYENGTPIQSEIIDYLETGEGKQGIQGCVLRNCGVYNPNTRYVNEAYYIPSSANYIRYIDYALYPAPTNVNEVHYYMVAPKTTGDGRREIINIDPTNTDNWIQAENMDFAYIKNLIADYISAQTIVTDELLIKREDQGLKIVAGMTKGEMSQTPQDNALLWAGTTMTSENQANIKDAPFVVYEDGHMKATNATINGTVYATDGSFTGEVHATSGSFKGSVNATEFKTGDDQEPGLVVTQNFNTNTADTSKAYLYYDSNDGSMNLAIYDFNQRMWVKLNLADMRPIGNIENETFYTINDVGSTPAGYVDVQGVTYSKRDGKYYENNTLVTSADVYQKKGSYNIICPVGDGFSYFMLSNCIRYKSIEIRNGIATTTNNNLIIGDDYTITSSGTQYSVEPGQYRYPRVYTGTGAFTPISSPNTHIYYITSSFDTSSQNGTIGQNVAYKIKNNSEQNVYVATTGQSATDYYDKISQLQSVEAPDLQGIIYPIPK